MLAILKCQQFKHSRSDKTELRSSKCHQLYMRNDEEKKGLDKFESKSEGEDIRYILFPFITFL